MGCGKTEVARKLALRRQAADDRPRPRDRQTTRTHGSATDRRRRRTGVSQNRNGHTARVAGKRDCRSDSARRRRVDYRSKSKANQRSRRLSVWLDTPFELCWQRIEASPEDRPLGRSREQAEQLYRLRQPIYQLADIRLPVVAHEPLENLIDRLEAELNKHGNTDRNLLSVFLRANPWLRTCTSKQTASASKIQSHRSGNACSRSDQKPACPPRGPVVRSSRG